MSDPNASLHAWRNQEVGGFEVLRTFRFRQDLQFIDSRGSLPIRRDGNRSMPTWALGIATGYTPAMAMGGPLTWGAFIGVKTEAVMPELRVE